MDETKITTTRRAVLKGLGLGAAGLLAPAMPVFIGTVQAADGTVLTVASYGGAYQEAQARAMFDRLPKVYPGLTVRQDSPSSDAKIIAMAESGHVTWDIVAVGDNFGHEAQAQWLEPIDYTIIDRDVFLPGYAGDYRLGADVEGTVIAYRTDKFSGKVPETFADFFDTKTFPGKRAVWKYASGGIFEAALIADGVAPDQLYPIDVERALKKLDTIRDDLIWWETGSQSEQFLTSGEAAMGLVWVGRAVQAAKSAPVAIGWGQWTTQSAYWVVPKGVPDKKAAMEALKVFTSAPAQAEFANLMPYGPTNKDAVALIDSPFKGNLPTDHLATRVVVDYVWWSKNEAAVNERFQEWLLM
ncbi:ABC transporter substrate-binding protein [Pseudoxanthobacter sp.]|uniref:ABC transporter substrate-binding protein n=1 Tax=Pseudoxanthobacter sp. TaxID=1925742 RepID=UPI002FE109B6